MSHCYLCFSLPPCDYFLNENVEIEKKIIAITTEQNKNIVSMTHIGSKPNEIQFLFLLVFIH